MFRGFATIAYFAADMTAAEAWYTELLGIPPYFRREIEGETAYLEYRIGDYQAELGIIHSRFAPYGATESPAGITERGDGFVTAWVVDPFGNIIGIMNNPHYLKVLATTQPLPGE